MSPTRTLRKITYAIQSNADNAQVNERDVLHFQLFILESHFFNFFAAVGPFVSEYI